MKVKVSQKQVKDNYCHVICVGYCDLSYLLMNKGANFYTCGVYGWNSDIYDVGNGVAICTGYRPFGNIEASYSGITRKYNEKAKAIHDKYYNGKIKRETKEKQLNKLLDSFIKECLQSEKQKNYNN
jgi:hypothetical protein